MNNLIKINFSFQRNDYFLYDNMFYILLTHKIKCMIIKNLMSYYFNINAEINKTIIDNSELTLIKILIIICQIFRELI